MSTQQYQTINFAAGTLDLIETMRAIVEEYVEQGFRLTVRQLYYQLVARGVVENTERSYKRITGVVNDAKMAGLIDWEAIEDRTREFIRRSRWSSGKEILESVASQFHMDMWKGQPARVFVIVEKEALAGVLEPACRDFDVPLLAARGYPSGTVLREFAVSDLLPCLGINPETMDNAEGAVKQAPVILHLGDHDPSGIDMSRDLSERFYTFIAGEAGRGKLGENLFRRIALNWKQIQEHKPPPNPAKTTDSRFEGYMKIHGHESWELDALKPDYLDRLVRRHIESVVDKKIWKARKAEIDEVRGQLRKVAEEFEA